MATNAVDIRNCAFGKADALLLDANIWLFLYGPINQSDRRVAIYSGAFKKMLAAGSPIYLEVLVLSEFINRFARLEHGFRRARNTFLPSDFKQFRRTPEFASVAASIRDAAKALLKHCARTDSGFSDLPVENLLDDFARGTSDFNDQVLAQLCKRKGLKLVTDDGDFSYPGVTVISANAKLLGGSP